MKSVPTIEVLRAARELISDPSRWTSGTSARRADGVDTSPACDAAARWCMVGAVCMARFRLVGVTDFTAEEEPNNALRVKARARGYVCLGEANDKGGHAVALAILDDAIAELEGKQS